MIKKPRGRNVNAFAYQTISEDGSIITWSSGGGPEEEMIIEAEVRKSDDPQPRFHTLVRTPLPPCHVRQIAKIPGSSIGVLVTGALPGEAPPGGVAVRLVNLLAPSSESPSFRLATLYPGFDVKHVLCNRERLVLLSAGAFYLYRLPDLALLHILPVSLAARNSDGMLRAVAEGLGRVFNFVRGGDEPGGNEQAMQPRVVAWPCALSAASLLAYGVQRSDGTHAIALFDALSLASLPLVKTEHGSPIRHLRFDRRGTMLASVSERGSHAHVFAVPSGDHLCKRNLAYSGLEVFGMSFTPQGEALAVGVQGYAYVTSLDGFEQKTSPHVLEMLVDAGFVESGHKQALGRKKRHYLVTSDERIGARAPQGTIEKQEALFRGNGHMLRGNWAQAEFSGEADNPFLLAFSDYRSLLIINSRALVKRFVVSEGEMHLRT